MCGKAIGDLNPKNTVLVFTHCDQDRDFDLDFAETWFNDGIKLKEIGIPEISKDRIFLFKGKDG